MNKSFLLLALAYVLTGCASGGMAKTYSGPEKAAAEVGVIKCMNVTIQSIDGNPDYRASGSDCNFAVLPGTHRVSMRYFENDYVANMRRTYKDIHTIEFTARKGLTYYFIALQQNGKWTFQIEESGKKAKKGSEAVHADYKVIK